MEVYNWHQKGSLYLWRYKEAQRNYPGWQITGDDDGLKSIIELINIMIAEDRNSKRTIQLSSPRKGELVISGCKAKVLPESKFTLYFEVEDVQEWNVKPYGDSMDVILTPIRRLAFAIHCLN